MKSQRGSVAIIALVFLLFLAIAGASWLPMLDTEAKQAKMDSDEQMAWYAAEAGYKRAYAALKNKSKGLQSEWKSDDSGLWVDIDNPDKPSIKVIISANNAKPEISYAVGVTNLMKNNAEIGFNADEHMIVSVGYCNGVTRIIKEKGPNTAASGDTDVPESIDGDFKIIQWLLNAEYEGGVPIDKEVTSVAVYFRKIAPSKGKSLDSFGGNYAQYFNINFFKQLTEAIGRGTNASAITLLKKVDKNGAPRTAYDPYSHKYYDVTPEHYLWGIYNNGKAGNNSYNFKVYWAYIGDALDDVMAYKVNDVTGTPSPIRPDNGDYYVTLDYGYFYYYFLPGIKRGNEPKLSLGNPVASLIRLADDNVYLNNVYMFEANSGLVNEDTNANSGNCTLSNYIDNPFLFRYNYGSYKTGDANSDTVNVYPMDKEELTKLLSSERVYKQIGNSGNYPSDRDGSWRWSAGEGTTYKIPCPLVWGKDSMKAYLLALDFDENDADKIAANYNYKIAEPTNFTAYDAGEYAGKIVESMNGLKTKPADGAQWDSANPNTNTNVEKLWKAWFPDTYGVERKKIGFTVTSKEIFVYDSLEEKTADEKLSIIGVYRYSYSGTAPGIAVVTPGKLQEVRVTYDNTNKFWALTGVK